MDDQTTFYSGQNAYQQHTGADSFLRYQQNDQLFECLAKLILNLKVVKVLDIGFSGRYCVFFVNIPELYFLNNSKSQLEIGKNLFEQLVQAYTSYLEDNERFDLSDTITWINSLSISDAHEIQ